MGFVNICSSLSLTVGKVSKLVMLKDLVDVRTGEVLDLLEERRPQAMAFSRISELVEMGLGFRDNSPSELEAFAGEMVDVVECCWRATAKQVAIEQVFLSKSRGPLDLDLMQATFHLSPAWLRSHYQIG